MVCLSIIPAVERLRQEDCHEFEISLEYLHEGYKQGMSLPLELETK